MSALLLSEDDRPDIQSAIERRDPVDGTSRPFIGLDVFPEAIKGIGRGLFANSALTLDRMAKPVGPANELETILARRASARIRNTDEMDPDIPVNKIIEQRSKEIEQRTAQDWYRYQALGPDERTSWVAANVVNGFFDFGSRAVVGSMLAGPEGGALAVGATQSAPSLMQQMEDGVDPVSAGRVAAIDTAYAVPSTVLPAAFGTKLATKVAAGVAINVPLGIGQRYATSEALRQAGYGDVADRYKPFDLTAIGIDTVFGAGFGALHVPGGHIPHEVVDAAMVANDAQRRDAQSPFGLPINNEADRQIAAADARAMEQIANGEPVDVADVFRPQDQPDMPSAEYAPVDPHAAERAELEAIFADVRDEIAQVLGDEEPTDWMASRGGKVGFREGSKLRDFIIDRATGLTSEEIALDYGIETTSVASAISKFRTRVEERVKSGDTLDQIAQEMRITLDVLQKSLTDQKRKAEARDVVLRFARKDLSNAQIAERMRSMGFEKTTTESVTVMKSQLRRAGHDIPKGVGKPGKTDFLTSRGEAPIVATPKSDLETALARSFGKSSQKLLDTGKVEVLNSISELNAATGREFPADTKAVNGRGKTFVVAENVSPSEARGILLHEVGVHHGMADMLGEQGMARLKVAMDALLASGNPAVQEARALAEGFALKPEHVEEETLAYLVEHHPDMPIVRRLLAQIRQWLWRAFPDLVDLTPDDLAMMAVASLRRAANADMRTGFSEWMTSFGGALATKEGRARWAATGLQKATEGNATTYAFDIAGRKVEVGFVKKLGADDKAYYDVDFDFARGKDEAAYQKEKGGFGSSPADQFGKIVAAVERFVSEHSPEALTFSGNTESLSRLYSRMALSLRDENTRVFEQTNPENGKVQFIIAEKGYDPKAEFPRAKELDKPLSAADMAARTDAAKNDAVARYLDWFRESGGDEMRASRGKKRDTEMNDPVKAAIAEDPSMKIPDEKGELHPVNEALIKADEIFKNAKELSKGFEAAGACAARHAASMVTQAELRTAELVGGFAWGAATAGAIANVAAPAIMEANNQAYADDLQRRADADRAAIAEDRAQFIKENPVTSIPIGRSLDNTIMHAADRTGVPENFLSALIRKESGGDAKAKSATSSATGMTQFVDATWRNELLRVGPKLGFKGDPYSQEALDLRKDPRWAVMVAAEYAKANAQDLKAAIGRDPTHGEVYLAHFMGLRGAIDLINAADQGAPSAAALFPSAAAANQNVFHGSAKDVLKRQTKGFSNEPFVVNQ